MLLKALSLVVLSIPSALLPQISKPFESRSNSPIIQSCPRTDCNSQKGIKNDPPLLWYPNFSDNPVLTKEMRQSMAPYLLPLNHRLKPILDRIFSQSRAIENRHSLTQAGFTILFSQKKSLIIVAKHPQVPGYLFKIYTDSANVYRVGMTGWELLKTRCAVAKKIRSIIKRKKLNLFTVADKWLYPLPMEPRSHYPHTEPVVLIVKDMHIRPMLESKRLWKTKTTRKHLRQLYAVLKRGYGSAFLSNNIPYTKSGKCAFIDTEYAKRKITLWLVNRFLSRKMSHYWNSLLDPKNHSH